jgi:hypothetical protein
MHLNHRYGPPDETALSFGAAELRRVAVQLDAGLAGLLRLGSTARHRDLLRRDVRRAVVWTSPAAIGSGVTLVSRSLRHLHRKWRFVRMTPPGGCGQSA